MATSKVLAMVMAGGEGSRLSPLTATRSKPAVPFGGRYRIVDFVLSNLVNSGIHSIYLLVQYKSQSLIEHVRKAWMNSPANLRDFITVVPPQMIAGEEWFQGTADAVYQNLNLIYQHRPELVAVFGADHIYRMDINQMIQFHKEREADVTVAALPVPLDQGSAFGIIDTDKDGRIREFIEKPANPPAMPGSSNHCFASMGNYIFSTSVLTDALLAGHEAQENDFGKDVIPKLLKTRRVYAYDFSQNRVPGIKDYEEQSYWRDVGTIEAYFEAHQDVLGIRPRFDAFNTDWPIISSNYYGPVAKVQGGEISNSIMGAATTINGARIKNCVLRREVFVDEGAELEDCIIMDYCHIGKGVKLKRTIVDRYNVLENISAGFDLDADRRLYHVSSGGIVVIPKARTQLDHVY